MFNNKYLWVFGVIIILGVLFFLNKNFRVYDNITERNVVQVKISDKIIWATLARTPQEITNGLAGQTDLASDEGMLFVYEQKNKPSFWMKGMNFPLDIIWINDEQIVGINSNVPVAQENNELVIYQPNEPVNYVLEVQAGYARANQLTVGQKVEIKYQY